MSQGPYLLDSLQHGPASVPGLGRLPDAVEAGHAMPLPVFQLPVEGVGQHQHTVVQVEVGYLAQGRPENLNQNCFYYSKLYY